MQNTKKVQVIVLLYFCGQVIMSKNMGQNFARI